MNDITQNGAAHWVTTDIFRAAEGGCVLEHWTNKEVTPPREELTNSEKF
ncbi:hypothetical protein HF885_08260 [Olsenella umbonata]|uniref:Uncharacterized protein n=1 Tax=Parafannyhessea umbonata TaxID=604330 RepID=A0A7X9TBH5_9ACTN|nr:hypothetical protein [Parafannyhessea umbonata]